MVEPGASDPRAALGRAGELAALDVYERLGFRLVARNWRCRAGELDLVVERDGLLVFCEVKTRSGSGFGGGFEAVTGAKQRKVRQLAELFLAMNRLAPPSMRFDVASVGRGRRGLQEVELFRDAF